MTHQEWIAAQAARREAVRTNASRRLRNRYLPSSQKLPMLEVPPAPVSPKVPVAYKDGVYEGRLTEEQVAEYAALGYTIKYERKFQ